MKKKPEPRNITKAEISLETRNGKNVIKKDYRTRNFLVRIYGRFTLRNEARAYTRLAGLEGIPHFHGFEGTQAIVLEYIPSRTLKGIPRGTIPVQVFDKLDELVSKIHSRGVAVSDLHGSNILLTEEGGVYIVDFANAFFARTPENPGFIVRFFMQLDRHAATRIRARYLKLQEPEPQGLFGSLYKAGRLLKKASRKIRRH